MYHRRPAPPPTEPHGMAKLPIDHRSGLVWSMPYYAGAVHGGPTIRRSIHPALTMCITANKPEHLFFLDYTLFLHDQEKNMHGANCHL
jgi:hypothetical protein